MTKTSEIFAGSWIAEIRSSSLKPLLGGKMIVASSRFETREMAVQFAETSVEINSESNRPATYTIVPSRLKPEIFEKDLEDKS